MISPHVKQRPRLAKLWAWQLRQDQSPARHSWRDPPPPPPPLDMLPDARAALPKPNRLSATRSANTPLASNHSCHHPTTSLTPLSLLLGLIPDTRCCPCGLRKRAPNVSAGPFAGAPGAPNQSWLTHSHQPHQHQGASLHRARTPPQQELAGQTQWLCLRSLQA